jgi:hypothetical protein
MSDDQFKNRLDEGDNFAAGIAEFVGHFIRRSPLMIQLLEEDTTTYIDELQVRLSLYCNFFALKLTRQYSEHSRRKTFNKTFIQSLRQLRY